MDCEVRGSNPWPRTASGSGRCDLSTPLHVTARAQARAARLNRRGFNSYAAYLSSPAWAAVRKKYRDSGRPMVCLCGDERVQLHHLTYARVGGDEHLDDLQPLCPACHQIVHALERRRTIDLDLTGFAYDETRAAIRDAQRAAIDKARSLKRSAFHDLPLHERLARLELAQRHHNGPIHGDLRSIERMIKHAEHKVDAGSGVNALSEQRQAVLSERLVDVERRLTDTRPDALDDLVSEQATLTVLPEMARPLPASCDGSMTCPCEACSEERAARVEMGIRRRRVLPRRDAA